MLNRVVTRGEVMEKEQFYEEYISGAQRITTGRTITETDFVMHAGHTGDFYPHHMDAEWCATQPFAQRIAHGTMTFAIGVGLTATQINPRAFTYGYERLRFPTPVHIGDTIHTVVTIGDKTPIPNAKAMAKLSKSPKRKNRTAAQ